MKINIEQVRSDLIKELTRRMKAGARLPIGVMGPKSTIKYIDSMSDSNARDWHSVVVK